mgnify:CR=1 FL=1
MQKKKGKETDYCLSLVYKDCSQCQSLYPSAYQLEQFIRPESLYAGLISEKQSSTVLS